MNLRDVKGRNWRAVGQQEVGRPVLKVICKLPRPPPAFQVPTLKPFIPPTLDRCPHLTATGKKEGVDKGALGYTCSGYLWNCCEQPCDGRWLWEAGAIGCCLRVMQGALPFLEPPSPGLHLLFGGWGNGGACERLERKSEYTERCRQD